MIKSTIRISKLSSINWCTKTFKYQVRYILHSEKMDIALTIMSSKGQIVIPSSMRKDFHKREKLIIIKEKGRLILKKVKDLEEDLQDDLILAIRTEDKLKKYKKSREDKQDILKELNIQMSS